MKIDELQGIPVGERITRLIDALSHEDWNLRRQAADLLAELGEPAAQPVFQRLMTDPCDEDTIYWGIQILSRLDETGLKALLHLHDKRHGDDNTLSVLVRALGNFNHQKVIDLLIGELGSDRWTIRQDAAASLLRVGRSAVPRLKDAFDHGNRDIRFWTVKVMSQMLGGQAIDAFLKLLRSPADDLRYYAVTALGEIDDPVAINAVITAFSDNSWLVRSQAADILEKRGEQVVDPLIHVFQESADADTRYWALKTLTRILGGDAIDRLMGSLRDDESDLKFHFIASLQEVGNRQAIELLIQWLDDSTWLIRKTAASALVRIGAQAVEPLTGALSKSKNENIRYWSVRILSQLGDAGIAPLLEIIAKAEKHEKIFIIRAFQNTESDQVIEPLVQLLKDKNWTVRRTAADALAQAPPRIFIRMICSLMEYDSSDVRFWIRRIMHENQRVYEDTIERFLVSNEIEKINIYKLLAFSATDVYVDLLVRALREGNLAAREELERGLTGFGDLDLVRLLLKKLDTVSSEVAFWLYRLIVSTGATTPDLVIREISGSSSDKLIWLAKIMGEEKDPLYIPSLISLLSHTNKNVRYEATKVIARFSGDALSSELLEVYLKEDEEGRIAIMENFQGLAGPELVDSLVARMETFSENEGYWIAKLLGETCRDQAEMFNELEKTAPRGSKRHYWLRRISEHIAGKSYL